MQVTSVGDFDNNSAALFTDNTPRNWIRILGRGSKSPNDDDDDPIGYGRAIKIRYVCAYFSDAPKARVIPWYVSLPCT